MFLIEVIHKTKSYYNHTDAKITYTLLILTIILEVVPSLLMERKVQKRGELVIKGLRSDQVAQYNLISYLARNKKHTKVRKLATVLICTDYLDQLRCIIYKKKKKKLRCMKPSSSSHDITQLICRYIRTGWLQINDIKTYRRFNDNRGQWTLHHTGLLNSLGWSLTRPFDDSIVLWQWHLATDFTFHYRDIPPALEAAR